MARQPRTHADGNWYHVGNRGSRKLPIFGDDADRRTFLFLLGQVVELFGVEVVSYCLMTNHYHVVLQCPNANLGEAMHWLGTVYTQRFNRRYGLSGPLFTGRFWSRPIQSDTDLMRTTRYVEQNPKDIVPWSKIAVYRWSSLGAVLGNRSRPPWLASDRILHYFDNDLEQYRTFMLQAPPNTRNTSPSFSEDGADSLGPACNLVEQIEHAVGTVCMLPPGDLLTSRQGVSSTPRLLLFLVCSELGNTTAETAERYGLASPASIRSAARRARERASSDPQFAAQAQAILALSTQWGLSPKRA